MPMNVSRRGFLAAATASMASAAVSGVRADGSGVVRACPRSGILLNLDSTHFFLRPMEEMNLAGVHAHVDVFANSQVAALLINTNANRVCYASDVWDAHWDGFDPEGGSDQPFFAGCSPGSRDGLMTWIPKMHALHAAGIDYPGAMVARCRELGVSPWISIRMNDVHDVDQPESCMHSAFWREHPEFRRVPDRFAAWTDRALDYGHPEVRDHVWALIEETLTRYDIDGLELDWMRFGFHFRPGWELEGGRILREWIGQIRALCDSWAVRRDHPITLAARVPTRPQSARLLGLDGAEWARAGIIDCLIVAPFWATTEFDVPADTWKALLEGTGVPLAVGAEVLVRPFGSAPARPQTPETARASAAAFLNRGSDLVYLFNFFPNSHPGWTPEEYTALINEAGSLDSLAGKPRRHVVTYADSWAPGEPVAHPLPVDLTTGARAAVRIDCGPTPSTGSARLYLDIDGSADGPINSWVSGQPCEPLGSGPLELPEHVAATRHEFDVPLAALQSGSNLVEVMPAQADGARLVGVEVLVEP